MTSENPARADVPPIAPIDDHLAALDFHLVLEMIASEARSQPGREAALGRRPHLTLAACERAQALLFEMRRLHHAEGSLPLTALDWIVPASGSLTLEESWHALRSVQATAAVRETILRTKETCPGLHEVAATIPDLSELTREVGRYFTREGKLREDATPELRSIRRRIHAKRQSVQNILQDLVRHHPDSVQDDIITLRADRYCIPLKSERRHDVPGILHERSGSGATLFVEPMPVVEINNELAELLLVEREEVLRIERHVAGLFDAHADEIAAAIEVAAELDAIQACAVVASSASACRPLFDAEGALELIDARHPLLDERLRDLRRAALESEDEATVVPQTIRLDRSIRGLVISGPNAGGKTVTLKTTGLLVAMAMAGLPVPAADGTIVPIVDSIRILIGDEQDVLEHVSTFSGYLRRLEDVLRKATPRTLLLLDELGSGTDPEEGSALAVAVIEHVLDLGSAFVVTTHLAGVQSLAISDDRICNASMEFDSASGSPTFRMIPGLPGRSRAIEAAEKAGLPASIIGRARKILGPDHAKADSLLAALQSATTEIVATRDELNRRNDEAERALASARQLEEDAAAERRELGRRWSRDAARIRSEMEKRLRTEIAELRNADRATRERVRAAAIAERIAEPATELEGFAEESGEVRVGDRAEHRAFRVVGEVRSIDGRRAELAVRGRVMQVDLDDLFPVEGAKPRAESSANKKRPVRRATGSATDAEPDVDGEVNLIGQRVDEAIDEVDRFLDQAMLAGKRAVRIIHGHGTGRLRSALREHLRRHPAVKSHRPGGEREGGDGATIAVLDV